MEIVLESLCEWIAKRFEKHSALKLFLLLLIFFIRVLADLHRMGILVCHLNDSKVRTAAI
ncbi:hypothetical protein PXK30_21430 [Phaeobacter gallaeciensis]|uniref:hypothetical protein n=1 Tax=Phaeobacter gallaeciensis TaxID=60890 RepID=UPI00237FD6C8|nr:hypothetical protein [Phaeobacter gallaeciensis]MDE4306207.1 hypothetical protein [Phaeobacter gallaeciensis]MDE4310673.1 hypothetical protein [Phaeobacter gallaeciensis]MDE4314663.1 hypothetical protein [Phaeobacter gallaeciensis]MDE4319601.1 hypothetical protein [Phaeobacter gallaeciensis]MDE4324029.1 hypothetical protein [Phaeobacter gallaeciensis]